jgi:DNA-binding NtrC family response regulator
MGHVLYLDDDAELGVLLADALGKLGHSVSLFSNAAAAWEGFRESPETFDLVLTDMSMPGMSGLEFALQVLAIAPQAHVVIATGCEDPNWADHARACGVRSVIEKPSSIDAMVGTVRSLLARS